MDNIKDFVTQYYIDNNISEPTDFENTDEWFMKEYKKILKKDKPKKGKPKKEYTLGTIMKGKSDLIKSGDKFAVETELNIKPDLDPKEKKALINSIIDNLNEIFSDYQFDYQKKN